MSIQEDVAAARSWGAIPRAVRNSVMHNGPRGLPDPDPHVLRLSFDWATASRRKLLLLASALGLPAVAGTFLLVADELGYLSNETVLPICFGLVALGATQLPIVRRVARLNAVISTSLGGLLAARTPGGPAPLTVRARLRLFRSIVGRLNAMLLVAFYLLFVVEVWGRRPFVLAVVGGLAALSIGSRLAARRRTPAWLTVRPRGGALVLRLDEAGVTMPQLGVHAPWSAVRQARPRPFAGENPISLGAAFDLHDPAAVLATAQPPSARARKALASMLEQDQALSLPTLPLDQPLESILSTAQDYLAAARQS